MPKTKEEKSENKIEPLDMVEPESSYQKQDDAVTLRQLVEQVKYLNEQNDKIWKAIHQKGLKGGIPKLIISEMAEVIKILNSAKTIIENDETIKSELLQDEYINKLRDSGNEGVITAESMRHSQVNRYREDRHLIREFVISATEMFKRLQKAVKD